MAESGLATPADLQRMLAAGAVAFLIGESLMRQDDVTAATHALAGRDGRPPAPDWTAAMARFTHFDDEGKAVMVDVSAKPDSERVAVAGGSVTMAPETLALIREGGVKKGDVLAVARLAGIMAAKRTPDLIPLCHPLQLTSVELDLSLDCPERSAVDITGDLQADRQDRGRDGSADRRVGGGAHGLRHVQGRGPGHAHRRDPSAVISPAVNLALTRPLDEAMGRSRKRSRRITAAHSGRDAVETVGLGEAPAGCSPRTCRTGEPAAGRGLGHGRLCRARGGRAEGADRADPGRRGPGRRRPWRVAGGRPDGAYLHRRAAAARQQTPS